MKKFFNFLIPPNVFAEKKPQKSGNGINKPPSSSASAKFKPVGLTAEDFLEEDCASPDFPCLENPEHLKLILENRIPAKHRAKTWRYLSNYIPMDPSKEEFALEKKRSEYRYLTTQHEIEKFQKLNDTPNIEVYKLIRKDVDRTLTDWKVFRNKQIQNCLQRVLFIYSLRFVEQKSYERL